MSTPAWDQDSVRAKLRTATVGIAGLGGLGSNLAVALVRSGIGRLILADFDRVEPGNLNRQQYTRRDIGAFKTDALAAYLRQIDPDVDLLTHTLTLTPENIPAVFGDADILAECLDWASTKAMFVRTCLATLVARGKKLVAVSGLAGCGSANEIVTHVMGPRFAMIGDLQTDVRGTPVLLASRVGIAALHEANHIIRWILEEA
jgi:sulfur carrier protein ThiS adenylyltransferase